MLLSFYRTPVRLIIQHVGFRLVPARFARRAIKPTTAIGEDDQTQEQGRRAVEGNPEESDLTPLLVCEHNKLLRSSPYYIHQITMGSTASSLAIHFDIHNHGTATFRAGSCVRGYVEIKTGNRAIRHGKLALRAYRSSVGFSVEGMLWSGEMTLQPHSLYKITFEMEVPNWLPTSVGPRQQVSDERVLPSEKECSLTLIDSSSITWKPRSKV